MRYNFYTVNQYPPHWFVFKSIPQEAKEFFNILEENEISYIIRGGFALAAIISSRDYQIKDIDIVIPKSSMEKLLGLKLDGWETFFNKNSKAEDVYSIFWNKGDNTYLKFDMIFMEPLPFREMLYEGMPIINAEYLLVDKLDKVIFAKQRGYESWKIEKNIYDCGLLIDWFLITNRFESYRHETLSAMRKQISLLSAYLFEERAPYLRELIRLREEG